MATVSVHIAATADDVTELVGLGMLNDGSAGGLGQTVSSGWISSLDTWAGLRFLSVTGPVSGATINSATITLNVTSITGTPNTTFYGYAADSPAAWASPGNLPHNATLTSASVSGPSATGTRTVDVTSIVQEIVNRSGWASGNNMSFVCDNNTGAGGNAYWSAEDYVAAGTAEAVLDIDYTNGRTVTPGVASLSLSTFAPKANLQINGASPTALATSAFAPQANLRINGAPPTALALSTFAPTVGLGPFTATPGVLSLTLSSFAPTVGISVLVTPDVTALSLSTFAPQANIKINGASPTALSLSAFAPQANLTINGASPTALSLSTFAPTAGLGPLTVTPDVLALTLSTFAPSVSAGGNVTATPGVLALSLSTFAPQLQLTLTPALVALTLATLAPSLGLTVPVGLVTLALSTFAPPLDFRVTPGQGALVTATFAPTIVTPQTVTPGVAALVLTRYAPVITGPAAAAAPGYAFLSDEPTARASVFDSRMGIATLTDAIVGRSEVADGGS